MNVELKKVIINRPQGHKTLNNDEKVFRSIKTVRRFWQKSEKT
jgi:hypothetical protein